jgi:phage FluMu protein Com
MTIDIQCTGCSRQLRVADEHAGKSARCPECQTIVAVPHPKSTAAETSKSNSDGFMAPAAESAKENTHPTFDLNDGEAKPSWHLKTPEGQTYGPVDRAELDRWYAEGRITNDCMLRQEPSTSWVIANAVYPSVAPPSSRESNRPVHSSSVNPNANPNSNPFADQSPYTSPSRASTNTAATGRRRRNQIPHRGGLILALGILSWVISCPLFGVIAWIMGSGDLREMRAGRMDNSGMGLTQAGQILGMIHSIILLVGIAGFMFVLVMIAIGG